VLYRQRWRLVEGNCFWSCHTCGSSPPTHNTHSIFCSSTNQQSDRQFSHLSLPPSPAKNPTWSGNFHCHISFIYRQIPSNSAVIYDKWNPSCTQRRVRPGVDRYIQLLCTPSEFKSLDDIVRESSLYIGAFGTRAFTPFTTA